MKGVGASAPPPCGNLDRLLPPFTAFYRPAVSAFPRRSNSYGLRPRQVGEPERPEPRLFALLLAAQRLEDLLWRDRHFVDADADGVVHRVRDRGRHGEEGTLAPFLRAKWAIRDGYFDEVGDDVPNLKHAWILYL